MFLSHFDVFCDLLLINAQKHGIHLFYVITKQTTTDKAFFYFKISQHYAKRALPTLANTKKAIWRNLLSLQNEAMSLVTVHSKEMWLVQENHATVKPDSRVAPRWNENLQRKQNWAAKSTNLNENTGKVKSVFVIRAALWAKNRGRCLEYCRSWKVAVAVNLEAIWFEFWMKRALVVTVGILSSVVGDSQISLI